MDDHDEPHATSGIKTQPKKIMVLWCTTTAFDVDERAWKTAQLLMECVIFKEYVCTYNIIPVGYVGVVGVATILISGQGGEKRTKNNNSNEECGKWSCLSFSCLAKNTYRSSSNTNTRTR
jgi:hypothetical protein